MIGNPNINSIANKVDNADNRPSQDSALFEDDDDEIRKAQESDKDFDVKPEHRGSSFRRRTIKDSAAKKLRQTFLVLNGQSTGKTDYNVVLRIMCGVWLFPVLFAMLTCITPQASPFDPWSVRSKYIFNMLVPSIAESLSVACSFIEFADVVVIRAGCNNKTLSIKEKVGNMWAGCVGGFVFFYTGYLIFGNYPPLGSFWVMVGTFNFCIMHFCYVMWFHGYYHELADDNARWDVVKSVLTVICMFLLCGASAVCYFALAATYRGIEKAYRLEDGSVSDDATVPLAAFSLIFVIWKELYYCISVRVYNATNPSFIPIGQTWLLFCHSFFMAIVLSGDDTKNAVIALLVLLDLLFCLYAILRILREQQQLFFNEDELNEMIVADDGSSESDIEDPDYDFRNHSQDKDQEIENNNNDGPHRNNKGIAAHQGEIVDDNTDGEEKKRDPADNIQQDRNSQNNNNNFHNNHRESNMSNMSRDSTNSKKNSRTSLGSRRSGSKRNSRNSRRSRAKSRILSTNLGKNVALMFTATGVQDKKNDKQALLEAADKMVEDGSGYVKHGMYLVVSEFTETFVPMIYLCVVLSLNWLPTRHLIGGFGADCFGWNEMTDVKLNLLSLCKLIVLEFLGLVLVMVIMWKTFRIHLLQAWFLHCHDFGLLMVCFAITTLMIPHCLSFIPFGMDIEMNFAWLKENFDGSDYVTKCKTV